MSDMCAVYTYDVCMCDACMHLCVLYVCIMRVMQTYDCVMCLWDVFDMYVWCVLDINAGGI